MVLIQNAIFCDECDKYLISRFTYNCIRCRHGYMVDGGLEYSHGSRLPSLKNNFRLCENTDKKIIKVKLLWGSYKDEKLITRRIIDLETSHLQAILNTETLTNIYKEIILEILDDRLNTL